MNADQLIRKMGDSLGVFEDQSGVRRYPDLEQDAMRYWLLKEKVNIVDLDQVLDKVIHQILNGE